MKRKLEDEVTTNTSSCRPTKRTRTGGRCCVLDLSNELLLRFLSYLPVLDLTRCERVCQKWRNLATDNELWREKFYNTFVRPRARRIPSLKALSTAEKENSALLYSSRAARWLEHSYLLHTENVTDWKSRYKIKFNWTRGKARTSEFQIGSKPTPNVLVKVYSGKLYTADQDHGLRIWHKSQCLRSQTLGSATPTALTVSGENGRTFACVGCQDGRVTVFDIDESGIINQVCSALGTSAGSPESMAMAWPYLLTVSSSRSIQLHVVRSPGSPLTDPGATLISLATFSSDADLSPVSLSLRKIDSVLVAGVAYAFDRFNAGWCLGLQEFRLDLQGAMISSRATSSVDTPARDCLTALRSADVISRSTSSPPFSLHPQLMRPPTTLSYCGCYILAGLPDNTLMVYTVTSSETKLEINAGRRLWGHTSAVSAAEVTSTGKALSISGKSNEMRYWELEDLLGSYTQRRTSTPITSLSSLSAALDKRGNGLGLAIKELNHEAELTRRFVSFDDEQAVVLGERGHKQILSCFDFA